MKYQRYKSYKQYRLPGYDYSKEGKYFITICTQNREKYFGEIENCKIVLSDVGKIVDLAWSSIPNVFRNISLDVYQIMPDHFHGIIIINNKLQRNLINQVPTISSNNQQCSHSGIINNPMELRNISIGYVIRWFKGKVKHETTKISPHFRWQNRYYDRIIRDEKEFKAIQKYIVDNVLKYHNIEGDYEFIDKIKM